MVKNDYNWLQRLVLRIITCKKEERENAANGQFTFITNILAIEKNGYIRNRAN